jgi:hypothetical protein
MSHINLYAECRYAECPYAECRYAECPYAECRYAECPYAECCYAECRGAFKSGQKAVFWKPFHFLKTFPKKKQDEDTGNYL